MLPGYPSPQHHRAGERCGFWLEHAQQVARLALSIFDQSRSAHGLEQSASGWKHGALLHDIGVHISYERHHRHRI